MSVNCSLEKSRYQTISNLRASGIQPGWTCSLSGCFLIDDAFDDFTFGRTPTDSCTLIVGEQKIIIPSSIIPKFLLMHASLVPYPSSPICKCRVKHMNAFPSEDLHY